MIHYDKVLTGLGEFGVYQKRLCVLMFILVIPNGINLTVSVFNNITPNFRCAIPGLPNDSYSVQDPSHQSLVDTYIPIGEDGEHYSQCEVYDLDKPAPPHRSDTNNKTTPTIECARWVYDESDVFSQVVDFDLVCGRAIYKAHGNLLLLLGMLVGSLLGGTLSDFIGRKTSLIGGIFLQTLIAGAMAFVQSVHALMALRFFLTVTGGTYFQAVFVLLAEMVGISKRSIATMASMLGYTLGLFVLTLVQYLFRDWRTAQLVQTVPFISYVIYWWLIQESPRWLLTKNRLKEARDIISYIAKVNKVCVPQEMELKTDAATMETKDKMHDDQVNGDAMINSQSKDLKFYHILNQPKVVFHIAILCFAWVTINLVYFGLVLGVGDIIEGDIYVNFTLQAFMEVISHISCVYFLEKTGRKKIFCSNMILSGVATLSIGFLVLADKDIKWLSIAMFCIGKLCITIGFSLVFIITTEMLPTKMRNSGLGFCSFVGRFSGIVSPYIVNASLLIPGSFGKAFPVLIFGVLSLASGLCAILLPETRNSSLPETFDDAHRFDRKHREGLMTSQRE